MEVVSMKSILKSAKSRVQYAKIFSVDVMQRMLDVLDDRGPSKITNLAMFSGLNHNTCKRYVYLMSIFGWFEIAYDGKSTTIQLTENGRTISKLLLSNNGH